MAAGDPFDKLRFSLPRIRQLLAWPGTGKESDKIHRVPGAQGHTDFGVLFEAADARTEPVVTAIWRRGRVVEKVYSDPDTINLRRGSPSHCAAARVACIAGAAL